MTKFKVGDRVSSDRGYGTVKGFASNYILVEFDDYYKSPYPKDHWWHMCKAELNLVEEGANLNPEWTSTPDPMPILDPEEVLYDESGSGSGVGFTIPWLEEAASEAYDELMEPDMVNSPSNYGSGSIECIEYIKDFLTNEEYVGYLRGNVAINSDGGPTTYYDFLEDWVTWNDLADYKANKQWKEHSFHLGNIGKAIFRWGEKGGTSKSYDAKKIVYSGLRVLLMLEGKESVKTYLKDLLEDRQFRD